MIDTARGKITMPWKEGAFDVVVPNWTMTKKTFTDKEGQSSISWSAVHDDGLWINGFDLAAHTVQFSAPRYYFKGGDNTNLIRSQEQLNSAFDNIRFKMREVLQLDCLPRWTRLDLVWNFIGNMN